MTAPPDEPLQPDEGDRRGGDRRVVPEETRRAAPPSPWTKWLGIAGRDALIIIATVSAIVVSVRQMNPIFAGQPSVAASLTKALPITKAALPNATPGDTSELARLMASPQFEQDRKAFAADLVATGRMSQARADSIAYYAVRESYRNRIPPAVVFGVLLTENAKFVSGAMSNVGAVGLMQVYPKIWLKELRSKFGADLASDSTNLKYGIYILKQYVKTDSGAVTQANASKGLLRYNGCVRGTNTPNCRTYPEKVGKYVEKMANSICGDKSFADCIAKPFMAGLLGKPETEPSQ
jgi:soluble lytic murein transglycosylase-like protein